MNTTFKQINFDPKVQQALETLGFSEPTEIQRRAIPVLLEKRGQDFHGQAQTGTGKTLAFGLPLIHRIDVNNKATQALVVAPTRELAVQICESITPFARAMGISMKAIYGGASMEEQIRALKKGVQIVVGTPGRVNDHLRRGIMKLDQLETLVLDEADIMLDMGFKEEVDEIIKFARKEREIWLFSATVKPGIRSIMNDHMKNTASVSVSKQQVSTSTVKQYYCIVPSRARLSALCRFIETAPEFYGFIFCQTKLLTAEVADALRRRNYQVGCLHGDMSQDQRNAVIKKFRARDYSIVVATDVAARGLDIQDLTHVINFSLPEDHESYVHRTGRTGRAGKDGVAITFINKHDVRTLSMIQRKFHITVEPITVPSRDDIIAKRMGQASDYLTQFMASAQASTHPSVARLVEQFNQAELHTLVTRFIQEKFLDSVDKEDESVFTNASSSAGAGNSDRQEIMFAVGTDDGLEREDIVAFLVEQASLDKEKLQKIRVLNRRTFIEVTPDMTSTIMEAARNASLAGRPLRPQFVEDTQMRDGRGGGFGGGRRSNGGGRRSSGGGRRSFGGGRNESRRGSGSFGGKKPEFRKDAQRSDFSWRG